MSEPDRPDELAPVRDSGMSLAEIMVSVIIMGLMTASLAMAVQVVVRQADNTEGRVNNARSEQNVGLYMPADLASAEDVDVQPGTLPCGPTPACPQGVELGGSNAVMLSWDGQEFDVDTNAIQPTRTNVSYRVIQVGDEFRLIRVECSGFVGDTMTCSTMTVLRELEAPPADIEWFPGTTRPSWIISVTAAAAPDQLDTATTVAADPGYTNKNAQRVVVTINGGGDVDGNTGGGRNQISLSAGGTNRQTNLSTDDLAGAPTFTAARSRCGGNFGLIIDTSGSINMPAGTDNMSVVRNGVSELIDAFAGTPIKLQVVRFSTTASTLGAADSEPGRYYDMLVDSDITALQNLVAGLTSTGGTNWEDGFFRMLRNPDGTIQSQLPSTILFFTDGEPTFSRLNGSFTNSQNPVPPAAVAAAHPEDAGLPASTGNTFSQIGWNRTERLLRDRGAIDLIGVYVNTDLNKESVWNQRTGYHLVYERANNLLFQQGSATYERASNLTFQISTDSDLLYQRWTGSNWTWTDRSTFLANNTAPGWSDGWHVFADGSISSRNDRWTTITAAQYFAANVHNGISDGFRTTYSGGASSWVSVSLSQYNGSNTSSDSNDGWRVGSGGWVNVSESAYNAGNTVADDSDNWRTSYPGGATGWTEVAKTIYEKSNTVGDDSDGWRATKVYEPPYDFFDSAGTNMISNFALIGNLTVGNVTGVAGGYVEATPRGGPYTNAAAADLFVLPNYTNFSSALSSVALGQCGGTVTVQTRVGSAAAQDPFTYENVATKEIVQTSAAYRSGTFDIALPGGAATTVTISPQQFTNLVRYSPAGWSCKSGGENYPFTTVPVDGHAPWTAITLTVNPNQAVSCVQQVVLT